MTGTTAQRIDELAKHLQSKPDDYKAMAALCKLLRTSKLRRSDLVVKYGVKLLDASYRSLGNEAWTLREQIFLAMIDCKEEYAAEAYLDALLRKFGNSMRVKKLEGIQLESREHWDEAQRVYDSILKEDPANNQAMKRQICIAKAQGKMTEAIEKLNAYLSCFMTDTDAWAELAEMYIGLSMFAKAAFCYEELILYSPYNYLHHVKYAEILYTIGGLENYKMARKYFAQSLELNPNQNTGGLYGLWLSCLAVASCSAQSSNKQNSELMSWSTKQLLQVYKEAKNTPMMEYVHQMTSEHALEAN